MWRIYTTYFVLTLVTIEEEPFRFTSFSILFHFVRNKNQIESNQKGLLWTEVSRDLGVGTGEHPSKASKRPRAGFFRCNDCCQAFIAAAAVPTPVRPFFGFAFTATHVNEWTTISLPQKLFPLSRATPPPLPVCNDPRPRFSPACKIFAFFAHLLDLH
jgi:hypothetical protein